MLQVLTLLCCEPPTVAQGPEAGNAIRDAKVHVLNCIPPIELEDCILGQYEGYADDPTIKNKDTVSIFHFVERESTGSVCLVYLLATKSDISSIAFATYEKNTPTFAAIRLKINNPRWAGVVSVSLRSQKKASHLIIYVI